MKKPTKSAGKAILKMGDSRIKGEIERIRRFCESRKIPVPTDEQIKQLITEVSAPDLTRQSINTAMLHIKLSGAHEGMRISSTSPRDTWAMRGVSKKHDELITMSLRDGWEPFQVTKKMVWFKRLNKAARS